MAVAALLRFLRWQPWRVVRSADFAGLCLGYLWLVTGLLALGGRQLMGWPASSAVIHLITVGALGSLTTTVMARTWCQKLGLGRPPARWLWPLLALLAAATLLRVFGGPAQWYWAAACWSAACLGLLGLFLITARQASRQRRGAAPVHRGGGG